MTSPGHDPRRERRNYARIQITLLAFTLTMLVATVVFAVSGKDGPKPSHITTGFLVATIIGMCLIAFMATVYFFRNDL